MSDVRSGLTRLLGRVARAHHEATGGVNPGWAEWYADQLQSDIAEFVGYQPAVDEIVEWLVRADEIHRAERSDEKWPPVYAELILGWVAERSNG
jgi:hypothetical protein